ncbi:MAG TPA: RNA-binding domain-containing protein [Clostridium sp.]|uniref:ATP-binding protein n=1 Tax=Clostridium sp. TaxID=1506 RepID=UPI002F925D58
MADYFMDNDSNQKTLEETLSMLISRCENELVEFKEAKGNYDTHKLGQYFSAISNEANLKNKQYGWLIFGVQDKDHHIIGTNYKDMKSLEKLKHEIATSTTGGISFMDIFELYPEVDGKQKRVVMFKIPSAVTAIPTGWKNRYYGRDGESLTNLSQEEIDRIRGQKKRDWSKQVVEGAKIEYLDHDAIVMARENYKKRANKPHIEEEVNAMTDMEFLTKLKLIIDGQITNAAMVLLGNSDFDYLLDFSPHIMWRLYDSKGNDKDYEIFNIPFLTVVDKVYTKIRNLTYRYMPNQMTLFPTETQQYDSWMFRELLNNCIAHQDYTIGGRIYVNEFEDKVKITNPGSFLPGEIQPVLVPSYSPPYYRNQLLTQAMSSFYMIDTASMGIRKVYKIQKEKFFPMPDYDFSRQGEVSVAVYGKVLNENYTRILFENPDFDLDTVYIIDRIQKNEPISKEDTKRIRKLGVVEGKAPNLYLSAPLSKAIDEQAQYIKNKGFDDEYYKKLIVDYLKQWKKGKKKDFMELLFSKLPDVLDEKQKENKVRNLLTAMKREGIITTDTDNQQKSYWILTKN